LDKDKGNSFDKARDYAFLLLKFRLRSEQELANRLKKKKFSNEVIDRVVIFLREKKFLDDANFTKSWIKSRLNRSLGIRRISRELRLKGVDKGIIESQISNLPSGYSEEKKVEELASIRLERLKGVDPATRKRRLYGYLVRRGFSSEVIVEVLNKLCKQIY
jgi:regulatory protein